LASSPLPPPRPAPRRCLRGPALREVRESSSTMILSSGDGVENRVVAEDA
jgi:hypothetical protein